MLKMTGRSIKLNQDEKLKNRATSKTGFNIFQIILGVLSIIGAGTITVNIINVTNIGNINIINIFYEDSQTIQSDVEIIRTPMRLTGEAICPGKNHTGSGDEADIDLSVPEDHIQYIWASFFDRETSGIVLITVTGPYQGTHQIIDGGLCDPILTTSYFNDLTYQYILEVELGGRLPTVEISLQ